MLMHIITNDDRYRPKVRKNDIIRHAMSPAFHETVIAQPISSGISNSVTWNKSNN